MSIPGLTIPVQPAPYPRHALGLPAGSIRALIALMVLAALLAARPVRRGRDRESHSDRLCLSAICDDLDSGPLLRGARQHDRPASQPAQSALVTLRGYPLFAGRGLPRPDRLAALRPPAIRGTAERFPAAPARADDDIPARLSVLETGQDVQQSRELFRFWFKDVQAWLAVLSMLGLLVIVMLHLFVLKDRPHDDLSPSSFGVVETIVAGIIGFYFGAALLIHRFAFASSRERETMNH